MSALVRRTLRTLVKSGFERLLAFGTVRGRSRVSGFFGYTAGAPVRPGTRALRSLRETFPRDELRAEARGFALCRRRRSFPEISQRRYRYSIEGDKPPWRPVNAYDEGRKVYVEFSPGIVQGEMPPLFVVGADGKPELVNSRAYGNVLIVDRLFAAAELRLGGESQQIVRIVRTDGRR